MSGASFYYCGECRRRTYYDAVPENATCNDYQCGVGAIKIICTACAKTKTVKIADRCNALSNKENSLKKFYAAIKAGKQKAMAQQANEHMHCG